MLPWVLYLLESVRAEYKKTAPKFSMVEPSADDIQYITSVANEKDSFDKIGLKQDFADCLAAGTCSIQKATCPMGSFLVMTLPGDSYSPPWNAWWRIVRLLSPTKPVRIVVFAHPQKRLPPAHGKVLSQTHVNGGMTMRCDAKTVVIYRKEEATRVLIHELFHASCSDPYDLDVPHLEADTEAWAELVLCAMKAKGSLQGWQREFGKQVRYAVQQANAAKEQHKVEDHEDYAWRYLTGRLDVWRRLGVDIPDASQSRRLKTLRFTQGELENT